MFRSACVEASQQLRKGKKLLEEKKYEGAIACYQKAGELGDTEAQETLSGWYRTGQPFLAQDLQQAQKWDELYITTCAAEERAIAQLTLGRKQFWGVSVEKNFKKAIEFFLEAIKIYPLLQGKVDFYLAEIYMQGSQEIPQDDKKAVELFRECCDTITVERGTALERIGNLYFENRARPESIYHWVVMHGFYHASVVELYEVEETRPWEFLSLLEKYPQDVDVLEERLATANTDKKPYQFALILMGIQQQLLSMSFLYPDVINLTMGYCTSFDQTALQKFSLWHRYETPAAPKPEATRELQFGGSP